ncbi:MAG TPA: UbiX family flavin prenyltransferase [Stellaceae bacterium]|nr:UbiX family flavin prenyltransferase [Stellaceae bacterium]
MNDKRPIVIGLSGASGILYGVRLLSTLKELGRETHLVMTRTAEVTLAHETDLKVAAVQSLASRCHAIGDLTAPLASGSFRTDGMIIAPCSVRTFSEIATGVTSNLLTRAADVHLKERRPLILMIRETPLHLGHLRRLAELAEMGAIIAPPLPAFYARPTSFEEMIDHSLGRVLDLLGLDSGRVQRWGE